MLTGPTIDDLLDYTAWQRQKWLEWLRQHDAGVLETGAGPGGDGRFEKVADLIKHIFSAEKRYTERLSNRPLTDPSTIPSGSVEALFQFGEQSRQEFQEFIRALSPEAGDTPEEFQILARSFTATPRKIVAHVFMHEIRHWAQIATLLRLSGYKIDFHDFLFSPVMDRPRREESHA
jgi:uncharacterized damage-inducible protein DinB